MALLKKRILNQYIIKKVSGWAGVLDNGSRKDAGFQ